MQLPFVLICFTFYSTRILASTFTTKVLSFLSQNKGTLAGDPVQEHLNLLKEKQTSEHVRALVSEGDYEKAIKFCSGMQKNKLLKHICPAITTPEHYLGLFKYLKRRDVLAGFCAQGDMRIIRRLIVAFKNQNLSHHIHDGTIYEAIVLSLTEDQYERVIGLLSAVQRRYAKRDEQSGLITETADFKTFMKRFCLRISVKRYGTPLRRFLTLHGEEFRRDASIFEIFCQKLVSHLARELPAPNSRRLLMDLIGHPSLLTTATFVKAFLRYNDNTTRRKFVIYGWREAIARGLKERCPGGYTSLWKVMVEEFPKCFSGGYPRSSEALQAVLAKFPTKQELEKAWRQREREFTALLVAIVPLPPVLINVIAEYAPLLMGQDKVIA